MERTSGKKGWKRKDDTPFVRPSVIPPSGPIPITHPSLATFRWEKTHTHTYILFVFIYNLCVYKNIKQKNLKFVWFWITISLSAFF